MFLVNTPSVLDETMRPTADSHVLSLEVLWTPYAVEGGWGASTEPGRWLEQLAALTQLGFADSVRDWRVMTPVDYERQFAMARGYAPSFPRPRLGRERPQHRGGRPAGRRHWPGPTGRLVSRR